MAGVSSGKGRFMGEINVVPLVDVMLVLTVTREGKVFLDEFQVGTEGLADKIAGITGRKPETKVYLRADKDVPYGVVVQVMAEARKAGVQNLGMVTEPEKVQAPEKKKTP